MATCSQVNTFFQAYVDGELSTSEDAVLGAHLAHCARCREDVRSLAVFHQELVGACAMHRQQGSLRDRVLAHLPDMEPALAQGSHPTDPSMAPSRTGVRFPFPFAAVAALLLIGLLGIMVYPYSGQAAPEDAVGMVIHTSGSGAVLVEAGEAESRVAQVETLIGRDDVIRTLEDGQLGIALDRGSSVKVNLNSHLAIEDARNVYVYEGQAFFDVGRDRKHFFVNTPAGEILVFGTAFVVDVAQDVTTVIVVEGDVLVSTSVGRSALTRGKQSHLRRGQAPTPPEDVSNQALLAWATGVDFIPDSHAAALYDEIFGADGADAVALPAEAVYAVRNLRDREVEGVQLSWEPDGIVGGHCGYFLHVTDSDDNLLFLDTVPSKLFNDLNTHSVTLTPPNGPFSGVDVVHIRLIPDYNRGAIESTVRVNLIVQ